MQNLYQLRGCIPVSKIKALDKITSYSFLSGLVASKIQYLPATILTPFLNIISISLYLLGYSLWFITSHFYPDHTPKHEEWYGFAAFKQQNTYAASLGIIAIITSIVALTLPVFALAAAWLFFASNAIWSIGEYHKLKSPPEDNDYSHTHQQSYFSYALSMTGVSLVGGLATTLMFCCPLFYFPILVVSSLISVALVTTAIGFWFDFTFNEHKKTPATKNSYLAMANCLGSSLKLEESPSPEPYQGKDLLQTTRISKKEIEMTAIHTPVNSLTYSPI